MALLAPHFDLPFRLSAGTFATVEQDSQEDVANCVECIVRTPFGFRDDANEFGLDDQTFDNRPLNTEFITSQIESQEPRATVLISENPSLIDSLVDKLAIAVNP